MTHEHLLDVYAKLAVRTGLNLQKGQQLLITAPLDAVPEGADVAGAFKALLLAENANGDGGSLCWFLHLLILGFVGKRQMSGYDDANQWGY